MSDDQTPRPARPDARIETLWVRFVAHETLTPEERLELAGALERDEGLRQRLVQDLQIEGALQAAGDIERGQEKLVASVRALVTAAGHTEKVVEAVRHQLEARARVGTVRLSPHGAASARRARIARGVTFSVLLASAAAAIVMLRPNVQPVGPAVSDPGPAALAESMPSSRVPGGGVTGARGAAGQQPAVTVAPAPTDTTRFAAQVETVAGTVYRQGPDGTRRASASLPLGPGDWIWTSGLNARARVTGPGGARVELEGDAVASVSADAARSGGARFFLAHGRATGFVPARAAGPLLVLASPHALVSGSGTIRLDVGAALTRVEVREGRARVSALGVQRGTDVETGQLAIVSPDDLQPPRAQAAPREAFLLVGPDDTKEGAIPTDTLRGSEQRLKTRLERIGFAVQVAEAGTLRPDRARTAALLVLSSSVSTSLLSAGFAELPVPMVVLESTAFQELGLTGPRWKHDVGPVPSMTDLLITAPEHPLAAGFTGNVRVLSGPLSMRYAAPPAGALIIASYVGAKESAAMIFAYERGATTALGTTAAARRVGIFLGNGRIVRALTESGWRLFDAATLWAAGS